MREIKTASYIKYAKEGCKGWTAVHLSQSISKKIQEWGKENIPSDELSEDGREDNTHITLLYGICTENNKVVKELLKNEKPIAATLGKISCFTSSPDNDVIIIKVDSPDLEKIHQKIKDALKVEQTHSDYKPHCTIAYVKKGNARKHIGGTTFQGEKMVFNQIVFKGSIDDDETAIRLNGK